MHSIRSIATVTILAVVGVGLYMVINTSEPIPPDEAVNATLEIPEIEEDLAGLVDDVDSGSYAGGETASSFDPATTNSAPPSWPPSAADAAPPAWPENSASTSAPQLPDSAQTGPLPHAAEHSLQSEYDPMSPGGTNAFSAQLEHQQQPAPSPTGIGDPLTDQGIHRNAPSPPDLPATGQATAPQSQSAALPTIINGPMSAPAKTTPYSIARATIEETLRRGELSHALLMLTEFYGDPELTPEEQRSLQTLLNQLAGTVIYSTEHELEPAYRVQPGDTVESIAAQYQVTPGLLAKINGIAAPAELTPGTELKVVRGPFHAVYDQESLCLMLDGRYAGRFTATGPGTWSTDTWTVQQKVPAGAAAGGSGDGKQIVLSPASPDPSAPTMSMSIVSGSTATSPAGPTVRVSARDMSDLYDILTIGSRVMIRQ